MPDFTGVSHVAASASPTSTAASPGTPTCSGSQMIMPTDAPGLKPRAARAPGQRPDGRARPSTTGLPARRSPRTCTGLDHLSFAVADRDELAAWEDAARGRRACRSSPIQDVFYGSRARRSATPTTSSSSCSPRRRAMTPERALRRRPAAHHRPGPRPARRPRRLAGPRLPGLDGARRRRARDRHRRRRQRRPARRRRHRPVDAGPGRRAPRHAARRRPRRVVRSRRRRSSRRWTRCRRASPARCSSTWSRTSTTSAARSASRAAATPRRTRSPARASPSALAKALDEHGLPGLRLEAPDWSFDAGTRPRDDGPREGLVRVLPRARRAARPRAGARVRLVRRPRAVPPGAQPLRPAARRGPIVEARITGQEPRLPVQKASRCADSSLPSSRSPSSPSPPPRRRRTPATRSRPASGRTSRRSPTSLQGRHRPGVRDRQGPRLRGRPVRGRTQRQRLPADHRHRQAGEAEGRRRPVLHRSRRTTCRCAARTSSWASTAACRSDDACFQQAGARPALGLLVAIDVADPAQPARRRLRADQVRRAQLHAGTRAATTSTSATAS